MKKIWLALIIATPTLAFGASEVKEVAQNWRTSVTAVSTTAVTALPSAALSGRYKIMIENTDNSFELAIGTSAAMTYATGFIVKVATSPLSQVTLPLNSGTTVYALGQAGAQATLNVRTIEFK